MMSEFHLKRKELLVTTFVSIIVISFVIYKGCQQNNLFNSPCKTEATIIKIDGWNAEFEFMINDIKYTDNQDYYKANRKIHVGEKYTLYYNCNDINSTAIKFSEPIK